MGKIFTYKLIFTGIESESDRKNFFPKKFSREKGKIEEQRKIEKEETMMSVMTENKSFGSNRCRIFKILLLQIRVLSR